MPSAWRRSGAPPSGRPELRTSSGGVRALAHKAPQSAVSSFSGILPIIVALMPLRLGTVLREAEQVRASNRRRSRELAEATEQVRHPVHTPQLLHPARAAGHITPAMPVDNEGASVGASRAQLAKRRTEQLVHVLPESIQQRSLHLHILSEQLVLARAQRCPHAACHSFPYPSPAALPPTPVILTSS